MAAQDAFLQELKSTESSAKQLLRRERDELSALLHLEPESARMRGALAKEMRMLSCMACSRDQCMRMGPSRNKCALSEQDVAADRPDLDTSVSFLKDAEMMIKDMKFFRVAGGMWQASLDDRKHLEIQLRHNIQDLEELAEELWALEDTLLELLGGDSSAREDLGGALQRIEAATKVYTDTGAALRKAREQDDIIKTEVLKHALETFVCAGDNRADHFHLEFRARASELCKELEVVRQLHDLRQRILSSGLSAAFMAEGRELIKEASFREEAKPLLCAKPLMLKPQDRSLKTLHSSLLHKAHSKDKKGTALAERDKHRWTLQTKLEKRATVWKDLGDLRSFTRPDQENLRAEGCTKVLAEGEVVWIEEINYSQRPFCARLAHPCGWILFDESCRVRSVESSKTLAAKTLAKALRPVRPVRPQGTPPQHRRPHPHPVVKIVKVPRPIG
eukprot:TRINITY_DN41670_c0_g1_i1.p1 TRINITY_DN41670_c0_g1~~TRINITY_DN41670_c0_g1_i1.p1  ORF type:complete len:515 (-),score=91.76 TRINITY_DN41670_c0_g1_i1:260-1600(-)